MKQMKIYFFILTAVQNKLANHYFIYPQFHGLIRQDVGFENDSVRRLSFPLLSPQSISWGNIFKIKIMRQNTQNKLQSVQFD